MQLPVYLDNNATTRVDQRVIDVMLPFFNEHYGNAASASHYFGWTAAEAVEQAREQVAALISGKADNIIFTSGATESVNLAIKGIAKEGDHIITCKTEHRAVLDCCAYLEERGTEVTYLPVDTNGRISLQQLEKCITPATKLIAVMYANNETGVIQPIEEIGKLAAEKSIPFFCDATQAIGKIKVDVIKSGIDMLALSGHKLYGPKGVGALYKKGVKITAQINGGGHEHNMRSGTLNVPGIVGLGKACELCNEEMEAETAGINALKERLENALTKLDDVTINGDVNHRLPNVTNLCFKGTIAADLMMRLNQQLAMSSGSACKSSVTEPSHVLKAMGLSDQDAFASLRLSLGRFNTPEDIEQAINLLSNAVLAQRKLIT